ncbi:hypothetical protein R1sor_026473 [Riccia sorocarpa]|uniref:Lipoxygenase n=1 Tax=Riccia sorocarpa TaxID=122646 RepID=A0ABD3GES5_9MARC
MQAASAQAAVPAILAVAGLSAGAASNKRSSAQNVGVKSSSYHGTAFATGKPKSSSSKIVTASPARASLIGKLKDAVADITPFKGSHKGGTVEIKGQLVISKQSFLDLVKIGPSLLDDQFDAIFNQLVALQLVSVDTKPDGQPKLSSKSTIEKWTTSSGLKGQVIAGDDSYSVTFKVPSDFGEIGAFIIRNNHPNQFYLHDLTLEIDTGVVYEFPCNSWVYNDRIYHDDRVFFTNKTYLPKQTPTGLKPFRERELVALRGDGTGVRQTSDRIYDYDIYNDLGNPDKRSDLKRPPLGGSKELPYPRRCRTGRPKSLADPKSESTTVPAGADGYYLPVDEKFGREKDSSTKAVTLKGVAHAIAPVISGLFDDTPNTWDNLEDILSVYTKGLPLGQNLEDTQDEETKRSLVFLDTLFKAQGEDKSVLKYPLPQLLKENVNAWMDDEEFGRQTLSGTNPCTIQAVTEFPPKSSLSPEEYGPATALTEDHIKPYLEGLSVKEAIKAKRLFTVDYRDIFLPYIDRINQGKYKAYAPRTIYFWTSKGTMKPVAIELSLPPSEDKPASNRVFTPPLRKQDKSHYWDLAKAHAANIEFCFHAVISHWMRAHAVIEPFVLSTHRNLSKLHPVHTLLLPLFRNTLGINTSAREVLIKANGLLEINFSPGKYTMEMTSKAYGAFWRFDHVALPADLVARGMAEPADESHPGGVKLTVDDYPFAKDGLDLWDAIHTYMGKYLNIVYKGSDKAVHEDTELQTWWNEIVQVGHGDKKDEPWWPKADSIKNLTDICATIAWIAGPHHTAVNYGQWAYGGFMPNRPPHCNKLIPERGSKDEEKMLADPEKWMMQTLTNQTATCVILTLMETLSSHAVDEEYQGKRLKDNWTSNPEIKATFAEFSAKMEELQRKFEERNADLSLKNRTAGPSKVPYTLMYPNSEESGITGRGVPYSITI